jgi:hypothetical protein
MDNGRDGACGVGPRSTLRHVAATIFIIHMRPKPIFDTNLFGLVQDGSISLKDWRFLLRHRPGHGCPLSMVTALELLAGFDGASSERFWNAKGRINLACTLSKGRILEDPTFLLCTEVLRAPFPSKLERPRPILIADYMRVVCSATSLEDVRSGRVRVRRLRSKRAGRGFAGLAAPAVKEVVAGPKREWVERSEIFISEVYPEWREHFKKTGKRLPDEIRDKLKSARTWDAAKITFTEAKLKWLEVSTTPKLVADIARRLDAVMEFTIFVNRLMLLNNYNLEKHESDVYDQFQLHYLAPDRFIIVTSDSDFLTRTAKSGQADRILPFQEFLKTL